MGRQNTWKDYLRACYYQLPDVRNAVILDGMEIPLAYATFKRAVIRHELCSAERRVKEYWRTLSDIGVIRMTNQNAGILYLDEVREAIGEQRLSDIATPSPRADLQEENDRREADDLMRQLGVTV